MIVGRPYDRKARNQDCAPVFSLCLFPLCHEHFDGFLKALDSPPAPGPELNALLRRVTAWEA